MFDYGSSRNRDDAARIAEQAVADRGGGITSTETYRYQLDDGT